jgi:LptD protein
LQFLLILHLIAQPVVSRQADSLNYDTTNVVNFGGKFLTYFAQVEKVVIIDSAWIHYRDMYLYADSIEYDTKEHIVSGFARTINKPAAVGESSKPKISYVTFKNNTDTVIGIELHYNVDTRKGMMRKASTEVTNGFFHGEEIWLVKEKTLNVNRGYYTTCDRIPPHYYFSGSRVRVLMGDMVIVQPVVLKIWKIPVAIAPFWFFPLGKNRKSGLSPFKVGQSNVEGYYAKGLSYYWVINDYSDMTFSTDFMLKRGFYPKVEGRYIVNPYASGQLFGTFIREFGSTRNRYSINAKHQSVFFLNTDLEAYVDYQSDDSLSANYAEDVIQWLKRELFSYARLSRSFKQFGKVSVLIQHQRDFALKTTDILFPRAGINFYATPLFRTWSISPSLNIANDIHTSQDLLGDSLKTETRSASVGLGLAPSGPYNISQGFGFSQTKDYARINGQISPVSSGRGASSATGFGSSQKIFQSINLLENFGFNENIQLGDTAAYQSQYSFSTGSNMTLYKIFGIEAFGLRGIMHQVTPTISYSVKPAVRQNGFFGVPRLDTLPLSTGLNFGLANLFQGKIGEDKIKRDLAFINFSSSYNFLNHKVTPINGSGEFYILQLPSLILNTTVNTVFNPDSIDFTDYATNTNFYYSFIQTDSGSTYQRNFGINLNHFWNRQSNMLSVNLTFTLPGWSFNIATGSNFKKPWPPADINLSVVKDLHCWELLFTGSGMGTRWTYDFKFRIKKIPEVNVGKGILNFVLP